MKLKKNYTAISLLISITMICSIKNAQAQVWSGNTNTTDPTVRSGNVGIGVTTADAKLHISSSGLPVKVDHTFTGQWNYAFMLNVNNDQTKAFVVNRMNGGTATPVFQVWGNGVVNTNTLYAKSLVVTNTGMNTFWPDYVFKNTYQLRSIYELENYIKKEHHLPNVPSAKDINEKGMDVYETNRILLEKIEELSLYVISLKKEIDEIKNVKQ